MMKRIYNDIITLVEDNTLVIMDQISMLSCLGISNRSIYILGHYLALRITSLRNTQLVIRIFDSGPNNNLLPLVSRLSSLHLGVSGLETGLSKDVSGVLEISTLDSDTKTLQFKLLDKDVRIFAPGTSSAVL